MDNKKSSLKNNGSDKTHIILKELFRLERKTDQGFNALRKDFRELQTSVDAYAKRSDTFFQEMVMLTNRVGRLERWIMQVAEKTGVRLKS